MRSPFKAKGSVYVPDTIYIDILERDIPLYTTGNDIARYEIENTGEFLGAERFNILVWFKV